MQQSILTVNCWLLPPPISVENKQRLHKIISFIEEKQPDIVALQEIWLHGYVETIRQSLPDYFVYASKSKWYNKSGLVTCFKYKPLSFSHKYFPKKNQKQLIERLACKGYHEFKIKDDVVFINTHLYAMSQPSEHTVVEEQVSVLAKKFKNKKTIIAGDFNCNKEHIAAVTKEFYFSRNNVSSVSSANPYRHRRFNTKYTDTEKIDHIVTNAKNIKIESITLTDVGFSDHHPILGSILIK